MPSQRSPGAHLGGHLELSTPLHTGVGLGGGVGVGGGGGVY